MKFTEEEILRSMQGAKRARPERDLFRDIEQVLNEDSGKVVPFLPRVVAVAAAVLLLGMNIFAIQNIVQAPTDDMSNPRSVGLISDYKIYE